MDDKPIRVARAIDAERFLASDRTVWFQGVSPATTEQQLLGLAEENRFAAQVDGAEDPGTYAGIYGVFPLTLSIPGQRGGVRPVPCAGLTWWGCTRTTAVRASSPR